MTSDTGTANSERDGAWQRYGEALIRAMEDVLSEAAEEERSLLLETAEYWLSTGLAIGSTNPQAAERLLHVIEANEPERAELMDDAALFVEQALG